jgi:hypothetical protein
MTTTEPLSIYQLRIFVKGISPMIWRRILVRSDTNIADLHEMMQILMHWYDVHLHHFLIRGKRYGIGRIGTMGFMDNPYRVRLDQFHFRLNETFIYAYNYYDKWELKIRVEAKRPFEPEQVLPYCMAGKRAGPPEDCGGAWRFLELKQHYSPFYIFERLETILSDPDLEETRWDYADEFKQLHYWCNVDQFDRHQVNDLLQEKLNSPVEEKS